MSKFFVDVTLEVEAGTDEQAMTIAQKAVDEIDAPGIRSTSVFEPYQLEEVG